MNQCDGCRRGLKLKDNIHYTDGDGLPVMVCTAADAPQTAVLDAYTKCAEICKKHASLCVLMGDGEKARTAATLADVILAARASAEGKAMTPERELLMPEERKLTEAIMHFEARDWMTFTGKDVGRFLRMTLLATVPSPDGNKENE